MNYLSSAKQQFRYYKTLGERTFTQLTDEQLFWRPTPTSNSIGVIVKHLWGNMLSRWTNFLTSDGEKPWREREAEFEADITTRAELLEKWEAGWQCLFTALDSVNEDNIDTTIYIRNMGHTVVEAINRQLAHYAYHVGQIVFLGQQQRGSAWESLSIPRGQSAAYNAEKFAKPKHREHFTEEWLADSEEESRDSERKSITKVETMLLTQMHTDSVGGIGDRIAWKAWSLVLGHLSSILC